MGFASLAGLAVAGIPVCFLPRFDPEGVLDAIEGRRSTMFIGVPAMYRMLLEAGASQRDLRSVRVWASGADVMPSELARAFQRMGASFTVPGTGRSVGQALFVEGYGMVEVGGAVATRVSPPYLPLPFGDALGVTLPGYRTRVVDDAGSDVRGGTVGELWVQGPGVLDGYHGDPAATAAAVTDDGWLRTGDLARRGPLGLLIFAGRKKDVIKNGGYSVFAVEVEAALEEHPDVVEAAVVGLADERRGEVPVAAVRLRAGAATTGDELVAWAAGVVAPYKAPRRVIVVDELPRTGTTKVQKAQLLTLFI
jgi:acyl-CoA synthetase (AMP-forming)/AMP-acid ligase II